MPGEAVMVKEEPSPENILVRLVRRMAAGDREAMAALYDETSPLVNGLLQRMLSDPEVAEEALLDTYMKAWKQARDYESDRSEVRPWLLMIARGIAVDRIRNRRARAAYENEPAGETSKIMQTLSGEQREVLLMVFFSGCTHSELAARLKQPLAAVKTHVRSALAKLRQLTETKS